jgi:hypothetical protein
MLSDEQKRRSVTVMPDALFAEPKLAEIYDLLDSRPNRPDLVPYLAIADEFSIEKKGFMYVHITSPDERSV